MNHYDNLLKICKYTKKVNKAQRFNIKGNHYINSPYKYYDEDIGLRNARLNFRQIDDGYIMETLYIMNY